MGIRQFLFGNILEKIITIILIIFLIVSVFIIIKNKIDITKKEDRELFMKSLGQFTIGAFKNIGKITAYVVKQEWVPEVEKNESENETITE